MTRGNTYAIVIRLETIKKRLIDGGALNCRDIAAQFDISVKTAGRDIEFLRTFYGMAIDYDPCRRAFFLAEPAPKHPPSLTAEVIATIRGRKII